MLDLDGLKVRLARSPIPFMDLGYHGTSFEAVLAACETGQFPVDGTHEDEFFLVPATFPDAVNQAGGYAKQAWIHSAAIWFGVSIEDILHVRDRRTPATGVKVTKEHTDEFQRTYEEEGRKGVVVSLDRSKVPKEVRRWSIQGDERSVCYGHGVPWEAVRMIKPIGSWEEERFRDLIGA